MTRSSPSSSRRIVLQQLLLGAAALSVAAPALAAPKAGRTPAAPGAPPTARPLDPSASPAEILAALFEGNRRFREGRAASPRRGLSDLAAQAEGQAPLVAVLSCADSRVPPELLFDQGFGDLFVTRVAGNVTDPAIIGSLEFGTAVLGAKVVLVLGHAACGAVAATMSRSEVPGQISTLYPSLLRAALDSPDTETAIRRNVEIQMQILSDASPVLSRLVREGRLLVAGGVADLRTGEVRPVPGPA